jgi:CheY-like chemotaxis protein
MSHELRTPLNSILILGQQLADNPEGNLLPRQIEFARTIHGAGTDLLNLISDILDLSKIESGTVTVDAEEIFLVNVLETVARPFRHQAESQGLSFDVQVDANLGRSIVTDSKRLQQILKNLLSNALKFTAQGSVRLRVVPAQTGWRHDNVTLNQASSVVGFEVTDTGVGIPVEKQKIVFEAFQQADASTSRKYGGTGLGLAISRELATLLGGELTLRSTPGIGSTFTLFLPTMYTGPRTALRTPQPAGSRRLPQVALPEHLSDQFPDDRHNIEEGERTLLIVEDDPNYAGILVDAAHAAGLKAVVTARGAEALDLALQYRPVAMSLDIFLPDMLGWNVLSQFKRTLETRHIPVQILSMDEDRQQGLARGAFSYLNKPTTTEGLNAALARINDYIRPRKKRLLIAEDNDAERMSVAQLLAHPDVEIVEADSGSVALDCLRGQRFDCMVLDLHLPDISGFEVLEEIQKDDALADLPVVVFTGRDLTPDEDARLHTMARSIVVKGAASPERLFDETALFLHQVAEDLPDDKKRMLERLHSSDEMLAGRTVLVVDDDTRNIFALSSALERRGMRVLTATTGREAISILEQSPEVAIVLMDIMMPEMDGYETIALIRGNPALRRLPIVALTAKAMKGDREKCLEAGASDYLAKPVNTEQLFSALRLWLHR